MVDQIVETTIIETIIHDQSQTDQNIHLIPVPIQTLGIEAVQMIDQVIHRTIDTGVSPTIGLEATQLIEINDIKTIDRKIIQTIDQII